MFSRLIPIAALGACLVPAVNAQFRIADREVQIHGFAQQGYAYSGQNNFLTMRTDGGSFAMTDGGINISSQVTDRFRAGAQIYSRNIGKLGNGRVEVDWAYGDYKFADWFGIRAGKVKTVLGLYNDTQDMEFLRTWALLPQSLYPLDLRASTIAHVGGDLYGNISLKHWGSLSYTAYAGWRPDDPQGGYRFVLADAGLHSKGAITGHMSGGDLKWNTPLEGLMLGSSFLVLNYGGQGTVPYAFDAPFAFQTKNHKTNAFYFDLQRDKLQVNGEYRRNWNVAGLTGAFPMDFAADARGWFIAGSYRLLERLEVGTYHSRFVSDWRLDHDDPLNRIYEQAITARFDFSRYLSFKAEGHLMRGVGNPVSAHGFYPSSNPRGLQPNTNLLVLRLGFNY